MVRLYVNDPATAEESFLPCPAYWATGLKCPGCGSQRAVHQLMHGNITQAIHWNALLVFSIPYILLSLIPKKPLWLSRIYTRSTITWIIFGVIVFFTVLRNSSLYALH